MRPRAQRKDTGDWRRKKRAAPQGSKGLVRGFVCQRLAPDSTRLHMQHRGQKRGHTPTPEKIDFADDDQRAQSYMQGHERPDVSTKSHFGRCPSEVWLGRHLKGWYIRTPTCVIPTSHRIGDACGNISTDINPSMRLIGECPDQISSSPRPSRTRIALDSDMVVKHPRPVDRVRK